MSDAVNQAHKDAMKQRQAEHRQTIKSKEKADRGLLVVNTGDGKGKTTAAFGTVIRALGWGQSVGIVQYVKGNWKTGEGQFFRQMSDLLRFEVMGEGFTWDTQDRERDIAAAEKAWAVSCEMLGSGDYDLVLLDELNIVLKNGSLDIAQVIDGLQSRDQRTHVIVTGRNAPQSLIDAADLVTEMTNVKHPFDAGIKAARGLDF
ncbi:MAG: cob(I)yrinic acid a,c-diamide adenosyltransferase [Rhodospirillales bacterium]|nr:cob(I)yrinic acid a,c-diamide adenosyltransferase [Rhodospirillales bacterium]